MIKIFILDLCLCLFILLDFLFFKLVFLCFGFIFYLNDLVYFIDWNIITLNGTSIIMNQ
jgi:hypothetical protein